MDIRFFCESGGAAGLGGTLFCERLGAEGLN